MSDDNKICYPNPLSRIDWQRSNADVIKNWFSKIAEWYQVNHCDFWDNYQKDIFDLRTCNDFGLSVWSIILDEPTYGVTNASPADYPAWGFGPDRENFNNGNFGTNGDSGYNFTTEERRILLQLKAFVLHMSGSVHGNNTIGINESLQRIFGVDRIICIDNRDMQFSYIIYDPMLAGFALELYNRDLIPRPVGIDVKLILDAVDMPWGFGPNRSNFDNGNFYTGIIIGG